MADNDAPGAWPVWTPGGTVGRIYKKDHYTLLHKKYESSGPCGFGEDFFLCFSHYKSMGAVCCHVNHNFIHSAKKLMHSVPQPNDGLHKI